MATGGMTPRRATGTGPLDRGNGTPLWQQLRTDLSARVEAGEFTDAFPAESTLQRQYGVSRQTVRQALRQLREDGVVTAERGRAPRLAAPTEFEQPIGAMYSLFASLRASGIVVRNVVRTLDIRADGVVADRLGLDGSAPLVHLERVRFAGSQPLAIDRVWLPADLAAPLLGANWTEAELYGELARRCGVRLTAGHEQLRAVVPAPAERRQLHAGADTAAFAIDRLGLSHGRPIEWRHTMVRGDRFSVTAQFSARTRYPLGIDSHPARPE